MPGLASKGWQQSLTRVVKVRDGPVFRTLLDASRWMLGHPENHRRAWQRAAELLIAAAQSGEPVDVEIATGQIELALLLDRKLDVQG